MMKRSYLIVFALVSVILLSLFTLPGCGQKGLEYNLLFDGTYQVTAGTEQTLNGKIVIPSTYKGKPVTHIGDDAFQNCKGLTSVTIPDSVTSISEGAFWGCKGLTSITIPDSVTFIGMAAFMDCTGLTSITIPDSVRWIARNAFAGCSGLTSITISASVTSIDYGTFSRCSGLTSITIPDSVTSIGDRAFYDCSALTSIQFQGTKAQWYAIEGSGGRLGVSCIVRCTNGDITKM